MTSISLTVLFEDPFWIGLFERDDDGRYAVCKVTFGQEPKDTQIYAFILKNWTRLRFSPALATRAQAPKRLNPKRVQRAVQKQTSPGTIGTKAQQALKLQHEEGKHTRRVISRTRKEAEKDRQFTQKQEKRRQKHRGH